MSEFSDFLLLELKNIQKRGVPLMRTDSLIRFIESYKDVKLDCKQERGDVSPGESEAQYKSELEMFKTVIEAGQSAMKYGVLLCGSAAVAVLAFIGNIACVHKDWMGLCFQSLIWFASGALLSYVLNVV